MPSTFPISCVQGITTSVAVKNPQPQWLNNSLSLYCTVTHCVAKAWSPSHPQACISVSLYGCSWPPLFNPFAPFSTQYEHCNNEGDLKVDCVFFFAVSVGLTHFPVIIPEFAPEIPGKTFRGDLAWVSSSGGKGDHNTCAFARVVVLLPKVLLRDSGFCPHRDLLHVSLPNWASLSLILSLKLPRAELLNKERH